MTRTPCLVGDVLPSPSSPRRAAGGKSSAASSSSQAPSDFDSAALRRRS